MPLVELNLPSLTTAVPGDVRALLREAGRRADGFRRPGRAPGFVSSDFVGAYAALRHLAADRAAGALLCEWGSGLGVVACLAAMLEFDAFGIEVERELVGAARGLAADFELPAEFVCGSFIPSGGLGGEANEAFAWLTTDAASGYEELGLAPDDFEVIFAYPWPDEEQLVGDLFERHAAAGAVLLTHHGGEAFRLRRKAHPA